MEVKNNNKKRNGKTFRKEKKRDKNDTRRQLRARAERKENKNKSLFDEL